MLVEEAQPWSCKRVDQIRDERLQERCGSKRIMFGKAEGYVLKWIWQVDRTREERMSMRVYLLGEERTRKYGKIGRRWRDGVKEALSIWGLNTQESEAYMG